VNRRTIITLLGGAAAWPHVEHLNLHGDGASSSLHLVIRASAFEQVNGL